jgi:hypothetical protein
MAQYSLYVDVVANQLVLSDQSNQQVDMPPLVQGDTPTFNIYLLNRNATYPVSNPFSIQSTAGLSLQVAIGTRVGNSTLYYTQQFAWTADAQNKYFTATLPLNTVAIDGLLNSASDASAWFEIKYLQNLVATTVLDKQVTIKASVIKAGALVVPPGQTPISAENANAVFLKRRIQGAIELVSPDGTRTAVLYVSNDGVCHFDNSN